MRTVASEYFVIFLKLCGMRKYECLAVWLPECVLTLSLSVLVTPLSLSGVQTSLSSNFSFQLFLCSVIIFF